MRKMTKMAVTFAAMSAMTLAASSMAFAATSQMPGLSASDPEKAATAGPTNGEWIQNSDGWKFKVEGKNLKNTWAEINGVWYYFENNEYMAQDTVLYLDGKAYFFDNNGTMATGWQQIKYGMDAYDDVELPELLVERGDLYKNTNYAYAYDDYFWMYFKNDGSALENEWLQTDAGLWYYFDEYVMIMDVLNYPITPRRDGIDKKIYGFDENGAMLTGWNYGKGTDTWNGPTATSSGKRWYYYNPVGGAMQEAGWAKIDGEWYLFADEQVAYNVNDIYDTTYLEDSYPLIMNAYVQSDRSTTKTEYFYVDGDGKMVKGVYTVPKEAYIITFYRGNNTDVAVDWNDGNRTTDKVEINFGSNGAAATKKFVNGRYYAGTAKDGGVATNTWAVENFERTGNGSSNRAAIKVAIKTDAVSGNPVNVANAHITTSVSGYNNELAEAFLIKSAYVKDGSDLYLLDKDGNIVNNRAVTCVEGDDYLSTFGDIDLIEGSEDKRYYIIFDSNGKAIRNVSSSRSVRVGNINYWPTDKTVEICGVNVEVFTTNTSNNMN